MSKFLLQEINPKKIQSELQSIGFDEGYLNVAKDKYAYKNIKIKDLSVAQANILKQTALVFGADCAVNKNVITGDIEKSNVILGGSISQIKKICAKLKHQPFSLPILAEEITAYCKKQFRRTKLVGILNITPNSFSDGGLYLSEKDAINHLLKLLNDGADIIDIGAESTKPYSESVDAQTQIERLRIIIDFINREKIKVPLSVDTRCAKVAEYVLDNGVEIINDVSGFDYDERMINVVAKYNAKVIIQHSKGTPENMQDSPTYENLMDEIWMSLYKKILLAHKHGIEKIIVDPGIGFGKSREDNFEILNNFQQLYSLNCPIMLGISRKSMLNVNNDDNDLKDSLSLAMSAPLINKGVDYLRVHNVKLHREYLNCLQNIKY